LDLKAAHARALTDLEEAEEALVTAQQHVSELRSMVDALERAMQLYEPPVLVAEGSTDAKALARSGETSAAHVTANERLHIADILTPGEARSIVNLSFGALRYLARPASTQEVRETIAKAGGKEFNGGKDFIQEQVRSALAWLMKSERVVRVAPGTWAIPKPALPQDDFTPADMSAGVSKTSESAFSLERV
jgi:hypothetical protein